MYERLRAEPRTVVQRSPIHNLGLFCIRDIDKHDMVIEYVGELVRPVVSCPLLASRAAALLRCRALRIFRGRVVSLWHEATLQYSRPSALY